MVDFTEPNVAENDFSLKSLNPLEGTGTFGADLEEGMNDPNRESLLDTFGQKGLVEGTKKLTQMVTPQTMWGNANSLGGLANDFVEFSPIGDIRDFLSAVNPNSGLDPLERGLGIVSVIPGIGVAYGSSLAISNQYRQRQIAAARKAAASYQSVGGTQLADITSAASYHMIKENVDPATVVDNEMSAEDRAGWQDELMRNAAIRDGLEGGQKYLATSSVYELAEVLVGPNASTDSYSATVSILDQIGKSLVREMPDVFGRQRPGDGSVMTAELEATQIALLTWQNLADGGLLMKSLENNKLDGDAMLAEMLDPPALGAAFTTMTGPNKGVLVAHQIVGVTKALAEMNIGPDLAPSPQFRLAAVLVPEEGSQGTMQTSDLVGRASGDHVKVILTTSPIRRKRLTSKDGRFHDIGAVEDLLYGVNYDSLIPDFAANHVEQMDIADSEYAPGDVERSENWYFRANAMVRSLAESTGVGIGHIAALYSGMSMRNAWAPENIVAGTHALLRFTMPELDPGSAEYKQIFRRAIEAGGWQADLYHESSKAIKERYSGEQGTLFDESEDIVDYYADINNFITAGGDKLRGMAMENQSNNAMYAALLQLPPDLVVRMGKTNNFYTTIMDPTNATSATIDVHANSGLFGFDVDALGSRGTRTISIQEIADGTYQFPSGNTFNLEMVEQGESALRDAGFNQAEIDTIMERFRKVPTDAANQTYAAQQKAIQLAGEVRGLEQAHQAQAKGWHPVQAARARVSKRLRAYKKAGLDAESSVVQQALSERVRNRSVLDHLEGNPQYLKSIIGVTYNASSDLSQTIPAAVILENGRKSKSNPGTSVVIAARPDGSTEVWADTSDTDVMNELRHLEPVEGLTVGEYTRLVPRKPQPVVSVEDKIKSLGEAGNGDVRVLPSGVYLGNQPGDYYVFEFEDSQSANDFATEALSVGDTARAISPFHVTTQQTGYTNSTDGLQPLEGFREMPHQALLDPRKSPMVENDWVSMSGWQESSQAGVDGAELDALNMANHRELRRALVAAVKAQFGVTTTQAEGMVLEQYGAYEGGTEPSYLVFGLSYGKAMELGRQFNQDAIATRNGMIYTTGENAGMMNPADTNFAFGKKAEELDYFSRTDHPAGPIAWSASYDFDQLVPVGNAEMLMGTHAQGTKPRTQVVVSLSAPDGWAPWQLTEDLWQRGAKKAKSATAYTAGDLHTPEGTVAVEEHVYDDGVAVGVWRTQPSGSRKGIRAYVPASEGQVGKASGQEFVSRRPKKEAREAVLNDDEGFRAQGVRVGDNILVKTPHPDVQLNKTAARKGLLDWKFDVPDMRGKAQVRTPHVMIDLNGPQALVVLQLNPPITAPGLVEAIVMDNGEVLIETTDPNDLVRAAEVVNELGYEAKDSNVLPYQPPKPDENQGDIGYIQVSRRRVVADNVRSKQDWDQAKKYQAVTGEYLQWSTGETLDGTLQDELFGVILGMSDAKRAPDFMKNLHEQGLTLDPRILGESGLPLGIHVTRAQGMDSMTHGQTLTQGDFKDRSIMLNVRHAQFESRVGAETAKRLNRLIAPRHFAYSSEGGHMQDILVHEIGHAVLGYVVYAENGFSGAALDEQMTAAWNEVKEVKDSLGQFGVTRNLGAYAYSSPHEFFAEAFLAVASGRNIDPKIVDVVRRVVELANEAAAGRA